DTKKTGRGRQITFGRRGWERPARKRGNDNLKRPPPSEFKGYYQTWATRIDSEHGPVLSQILAQAMGKRVGSGDWRAASGRKLGRLELREFKYPGPGTL
ncbi:hypothetical protein BO94DRAFT_422593, partial [Aspergillus sclerotioniger CBS 115572]